jgi:hypothetical protein
MHGFGVMIRIRSTMAAMPKVCNPQHDTRMLKVFINGTVLAELQPSTGGPVAQPASLWSRQ